VLVKACQRQQEVNSKEAARDSRRPVYRFFSVFLEGIQREEYEIIVVRRCINITPRMYILIS